MFADISGYNQEINHYVASTFRIQARAVPGLKIFRWLGISSLLAYRLVSWALLITSFVFALIVCAARFWLLPNIESFREPIAQHLSAATGQRVTIGKLEGHWSGVNLQLTLNDFVLFDQASQPALKLAQVNSVLSWWSLVYWEPRFDLIGIETRIGVLADARLKFECSDGLACNHLQGAARMLSKHPWWSSQERQWPP